VEFGSIDDLERIVALMSPSDESGDAPDGATGDPSGGVPGAE
jgi:hypothetical protein